MKQRQLSTKKGFTIIEVVLVLAIAGLIFLMVFLALPALQRNQRDTQRKNDLSRVQSAINSFQANNRGTLPSDTDLTGTNFISKYMKTEGNDTFQDPDGTAYTFKAGPAATATSQTISSAFSTQAGAITFVKSAVCQGESYIKSTGGNKIAFLYKLEGGGVYCLNN